MIRLIEKRDGPATGRGERGAGRRRDVFRFAHDEEWKTR